MAFGTKTDREALTINGLDGVALQIEARDHRLIVDQPIEDGGKNRGMTPIELLVASLGSCIAYFAVRYCDRHNRPAEGLQVKMGWEYAEKPHRIGSMTAEVTLPGDWDPASRERLQNVLENCTVHNSISIAPKISVKLI